MVSSVLQLHIHALVSKSDKLESRPLGIPFKYFTQLKGTLITKLTIVPMDAIKKVKSKKQWKKTPKHTSMVF
jgi:hypothetical protein